jgi:siroheme synthase (precorrin-2 oxidase/ferrochelatase)
MFGKELITLIAAVIAAITSITGLILNSKLLINREKRMLLWQKELDRIFELEEIAGTAVEIATMHKDSDRLTKYFLPTYDKLDEASGRFARYPELQNAIRNLLNLCAAIVDAKINHHDHKEENLKLSDSYRTLINICDKTIGRP